MSMGGQTGSGPSLAVGTTTPGGTAGKGGATGSQAGATVGQKPAGQAGKGGIGTPQLATPSGGSTMSASSMYASPQQQAQRNLMTSGGNTLAEQANNNLSIYDHSASNMQGGSMNTAQGAHTYRDFVNNSQPNLAMYGGDTLSKMAQYSNPFTQGVIDRSMNDISRQTAMQQNANASDAAMSGAFGGSRHGIVEALTNSEAQKNMGDLSAQLRNQGFNTAAQLAQDDVSRLGQNYQFNANQRDAGDMLRLNAAGGLLNAGAQQGNLANQQFNMGNTLDDRQFAQGEFARQLQQQVMNGANGQFTNTTMQPQQLLSTLLQSLGMSPLNNAGSVTGTTTPGLFDYLSLGFQTLGGRGE